MSSSGASDFDLLLAGGARDPNLAALAAAADRAGLRVASVFHDVDEEPSLAWNLQEGTLGLQAQPVSAAAAFIRYDVFTPTDTDPMRLDRSHGWYSTILGWCLSTPGTRIFNRAVDSRASNKMYVLERAKAHHLATPKTLVTNQRSAIEAFQENGALIVKPAGGGSYCQASEDAISSAQWDGDIAPIPAIVQERLSYPELRVYRIGNSWLLYEIHSDSLDYRAEPNSRITLVDAERLGAETLAKLERLTDELGIDFCAFDLKTRPQDNTLVLLEVNTAPMFAAYDQVANGALCSAILNELIGSA